MATTYQPTQWLMPKNANQDKVGNYSFDFDGATDGISMAAPTNNNAGDISWSIWVYPTSFAAYNYFIDSGAVSINERGIFAGFEGTTGYLALNRRQSGTDKRCLTGFVDVGATINNWHHIVGVYDEDGGTAGVGQLKMYVNGVLKHTEDGSGTDLNDTTTLYIGQIYSGLPAYRFLGKISEVSIFNYPLTDGTVDPADNQIADLYGSAGAGVGNPMGLDPVPVGYWKGDRAALGAQWAVPNQVSKDYVFDFDGSTSYIDLGNSSTLNPTGALTVSTWVKRTGAGTGTFPTIYRSSGLTNGTTGYILTTYSDKVRFYIWDGSWKYAEANAVIINDQWYNLIGVWNGSTVSLYIDGILQTTTGSASSIIYDTTNDAFIGRYRHVTGNDYFEGEISNVAIWDTDQSGNKDTIFNNGTPGDLTALSPVSWWKLDDSATFSTDWSIPDDGSASNTGTSSGMTQGNLVPDTVTRGTAMYSEYSFDFDGTGDYFTMGNVLDKSIGDSFSISAWIKLSSIPLTWKLIVSKMDNTNPWNGYQFSISDTNKLYMGLRGTAEMYSTSSTVFVADTWYHVAGTYDGSGVNTGINIYINGILDNGTQSGTFAGTLSNSTDLQISGRDGANILFLGNISNAAIFSSELSAANILTIYNNGRPGDLTSLSPTSWWRVGEEAFCPDYTATPDVWEIPDQIGSNDGTSAGNPDLVGEAPQSFANGLSVSMDIDDRIGESGFSDNNALSYNMDSEARVEDVPA
jgi:hypothetical protein